MYPVFLYTARCKVPRLHLSYLDDNPRNRSSKMVSSLSSRATQANLLLCWKMYFVASKNRNDRDLLQQRCPSLMNMLHTAIDRFSPEDFGRLFAVIRKCAMELTSWLMTSSSDSELYDYCSRLRDYLYLRCRDDIILNTGNGAMQDIAEYLTVLKEHEPFRFPDRKPSEDPWHFCNRFWDALLDEHQMEFHANYSFPRFVNMTRGYRREMLHQLSVRPRTSFGLVPTVNVAESDVRITDGRISPSEFCRTTKTFPEGEACPVCAEDLKEDVEGEVVVVTKCGHHYHNQCLDSWVNDSLADNSNKCPACRAELCASRQSHSPVA